MGRKHKKKGSGWMQETVKKVYGGNVECNGTVGKKWGDNQKAEDSVTCSLVNETDVLITLTAKQKIILMMKEYTSKEWLGYMVGQITAEGHFLVEDLVIPPHKEACYSSAEAEPFHIPQDCIGVIHSHHTMGAFHSGTDSSHVDRNFPISITVARGTDDKLNYDAKSCKETPCGKFLMVNATVKYLSPEPTFDVEVWLEEAKNNVEKGSKVYGATKIEDWRTKYPNLAKNQIQMSDYGGFYGNCYGDFDRQAITKEAAKEEDKKEASWGDKDRPVMITKKMIDKLSSKIFNTKGVILSRSQLEEILQKDPQAYLDDHWSI